MIKFNSALLVAGLLLTSAAQAAPAETPRAKYERLFDAAWKTVDENFYDPQFHGADWKAVGRRYRAELPRVTDDAAFEALVSRMLGELKSSHLHVRPPSASSARSVAPAFETGRFDGLRVITQIAPASDAKVQGLRVGDAVVSGAIGGPLGSVATLDVESCTGERRSVSVRREAAFWPPARPAFYWSQTTVRPGVTIGYLRADRFDDGAAELADAAMKDLADVSALIVDVRNNSGGNVSALRLAGYFGGGEEPAVVLLSRPYLQKHGAPKTSEDLRAAPKAQVYTTEGVVSAMTKNDGSAAFWTEDLGERRFTKPVVVLMGEDTGSAAEGFAWYMRLRTQARLIGRPSAGALLSGERMPIGDGWTLTVPVYGLWGPDGRSFNDAAVPPHETVAFGRADLCAGRDPDMAKALELLAPAS